MIKSPDVIVLDQYWLGSLKHQRDRSGGKLRLKKLFFTSLAVHAILLSVFMFRPMTTPAKLTFGAHYTVDLVRDIDSPLQQRPSAQNTFSEEMKGLFTEKSDTAILRAKTEKLSSAPIHRIDAKSKASQNTSPVDAAIENIRKKLASAPSGSSASSQATQGKTAREEAAMHDYYQSIWSIIRTNWAFPDELLQGKNFMTVVRVRIMRNGEVRDLSFEQKSSYALFDESAMNAVRKASPLPPLPGEISGSSIELGIRFYSSQLAGH